MNKAVRVGAEAIRLLRKGRIAEYREVEVVYVVTSWIEVAYVKSSWTLRAPVVSVAATARPMVH